MPPLVEFVIVDIGARVFRKPKKKDGSLASPIGDQGAETAALALPWPWDALLDKAAAKIGIDKTPFGSQDGFSERFIRNAFTALKAREAFNLVDPHSSPTQITIAH